MAKAKKARTFTQRERFADVLAERTVAMQGEIDALRHALASTTNELDSALAARDSARNQIEAERREYIAAKAKHDETNLLIMADRNAAIEAYDTAINVAEASADALSDFRAEAQRVRERIEHAAAVNKGTPGELSLAMDRVWDVVRLSPLFRRVTT